MRTRVLALLGGLLLLGSSMPAHAVEEVTRLAGTNRYATSAAVNCCNADGTLRRFNSVVLATGLTFTDALLGSYLAGLEGGIVLLTDGETLDPEIEELLDDASAGSVTSAYVLGDEDTISAEVVEQMGEALGQDNNIAINRIAEDNAIDLSVALARRQPDQIGGIEDGTTYAIVATVGGFADSLSAGPIAYAQNMPILFSRPGDLPPQVSEALEDLHITNVLIVGGTAAVDNAVQAEITGLGINVQRLAGPTRQETSVAVAEFANSAIDDMDGKEFAIARGDHYADALAGSTHGGHHGAPILLSQSSTQLGFAAAGFLQRQSGTLEAGWAFGGTGALSDSVLEEARVASEGN